MLRRMVTENTAPTAAGEQSALKRVMGSKLLYFFVIGDILGTGIYALTGSCRRPGRWRAVAAVPGRVRVAFLTAFAYLELVGKYPQAAGAALYTNRAFNKQFLTFLVAFTVMCSGHHVRVGGRRTRVRRHLPARARSTSSCPP